MPTPRLTRGIILVGLLGLSLLSWGLWGEAHQSGCHRWHSCPSDTGSYVCGDLGYCSQCPDNQYCQGGEPRPGLPPPAPPPAPPPDVLTPSAPAATVVLEDYVGLFIRGQDDEVYVNWRFPDAQWTGWGLVPGGASTPSSPAAVVLEDFLGLFIRGQDNRLYVNWRFPDNQWTGWGLVPGGGTTTSAPAAVVLDGFVGLFIRGGDNRVYVNWRFPNNQWTGWGAVPD